MKKMTIIFTVAAFLVAGTGCLKDKGFEDKKYGIDIREVKGIAFPQAPSSPVLGSINSQTTPSIVQGPYITLEQEGSAAGNVTATIVQDNTLVTAAGYTPLPAGSFTLSTTSVVIPAGAKSSDELKITIPNSTVLDPTKTYGIGLTISAVDQGYVIASNSKSIVIGFTIKNKYDGVYKLKVKTTGWASFGIADGVSGTYPDDFDIITVAENSVSSFSNYRGDNLLPAFAGGAGTLGGPTAFGATTPLFVFNNATNELIDVRNTTPDDGRGRALSMNPAVTTSRYDPATKTIYASFIMKQNGRPNQIFYDTLTYIKAR
jgi:hypothetical protein